MRTFCSLALALLSTVCCFGQSPEFTVHSNGLIYSDTTMRQLAFIVDSLNLKFKVCDPNQTYYSPYQATGHYITLREGDIQAAVEDIRKSISVEDFLGKYPACIINRDELILKKHDTDNPKYSVEFESVPLGKNQYYGHRIRISNNAELYNRNLQNTWVYSHYPGNANTQESVQAFYFTSEFVARPLPEYCARMVQYVDCMVDTTTQIFREVDRESVASEDSLQWQNQQAFLDYVHTRTKKPVYEGRDYDESASEETRKEIEKEFDDFYARLMQWDSLRISLIDSLLVQDEKFQSLLDKAVAEALAFQASVDDEFEEYTWRYHSAKAALELKRHRRVRGMCSQDQRPRIHAMNIAILSAETVNWPVFLRAHLDIMNDRFTRMSDGSYAQATRKTYIRELEELDINVPDLLLGTALLVDNPSGNHYYGNIARLGRALAETQFAAEIENNMIKIIEDSSVDDYNRIRIYYLFMNYTYYRKENSGKQPDISRLKQAVQKLPKYLASRITFEE